MKESDTLQNKPIPALTSHPKQLGGFIHIIIWGLLFCFPFLFSGRNSESIGWSDYLRFATVLVGIILVFYVNYYYLIKRFLFTRQTKWYLLSNLLLFAVLIIVVYFIMEQIPEPEGRERGPRHNEPSLQLYVMFLFFDFIKYLFTAALSVALKMTSSWYKMETERTELEKSRTEAELQNLKSQLNPHFLFNTLNNIYSLIAISPEQAQEAVHDLSRLLRYVLYESSESYVTVGKDLDFLHNYVELMRIRLPKHAELKTEIQTTSPDTLIAPLLFITLIENAFKHGVSNNKPSFIQIEIAADNKQIICYIRNSYFPKDDTDKSGSGIGLVNLRKRLNLLYPGKYSFVYGQEGNDYNCKLELTLD
ncbi:MAG: sensor histidine kinase [Tannerellaceae bacterium]|jgi:sensor histidine kinase YesM|nr:sensor histidine kinase [Tannerellaceae bacterium]